MSAGDKLITVAIHTYEKAIILKTLLEREGIETVIHNVNLIQPVISSGVRVRIHERDLPMALQIIEATSNLNGDCECGAEKAKVLIPVDLSDYSLKACELGFDFAYRIRGEVVLMYSYFNEMYSGILSFNSDEYEEKDSVPDDSSLEKVSNEKMSKFSVLIQEKIDAGELRNVKFSTVVAEGIPENAILDYSKEIKPKVIVMGTRGKNRKEALGSVTAEVLDAGKYPVLTVPENVTLNAISKIRNVAFFSILNQQDMLSFDAFSRTMGDLPLNITIIPVEEKRNAANIDESLASLIGYCEKRYSFYRFDSKRIVEKDFVAEFDKYVKESKIDLILIPNKKKNIFARLFNPSVAHKMIFYSDTPMLVVPV